MERMIEKIKKYIEPDKKIRTIGFIVLALLIATSIISFVTGSTKLNSDPGELKYQGSTVMERDDSYEDYDEDFSDYYDEEYYEEDYSDFYEDLDDYYEEEWG